MIIFDVILLSVTTKLCLKNPSNPEVLSQYLAKLLLYFPMPWTNGWYFLPGEIVFQFAIYRSNVLFCVVDGLLSALIFVKFSQSSSTWKKTVMKIQYKNAIECTWICCTQFFTYAMHNLKEEKKRANETICGWQLILMV